MRAACHVKCARKSWECARSTSQSSTSLTQPTDRAHVAKPLPLTGGDASKRDMLPLPLKGPSVRMWVCVHTPNIVFLIPPMSVLSFFFFLSPIGWVQHITLKTTRGCEWTAMRLALLVFGWVKQRYNFYRCWMLFEQIHISCSPISVNEKHLENGITFSSVCVLLDVNCVRLEPIFISKLTVFSLFECPVNLKEIL